MLNGPEIDHAGAPSVAPVISRPSRRLLFLSHAAPQDDVFARWLATQLAIAGYEVWCDITKLLGGERFWNDISEAINDYAFRFLFISTLEANRKLGTLREVRLALKAQTEHGLKDFIIPLKADQFPFASMQQPLPDLNGIRFDENWAAGLSQLLKLLEREGAPKSSSAGPACVTEWYRRSLERRRQIVVSNERCHSNWFRMRLPKHLHFHLFKGPADTLDQVVSLLSFPHRVHGTYLATFAPLHEVQDQLGPGAAFGSTLSVEVSAFLKDGDEQLAILAFDAANIASDLVRQAWESTLSARELGSRTLASGLAARFFQSGQLEKNRAYYRALGGRRAYRQLVGNKSKRTPDGKKEPDGFWHYALSASPQLTPFPRIVLRHHVVFSDDGKTPWENSARMHKARRSVCKRWWNREWRDRLFAFVAELARGGKQLALPVGGQESITVFMIPMSFISPWTFFEGSDDGLDETTEIELVEEDDEEGDDDDETV